LDWRNITLQCFCVGSSFFLFSGSISGISSDYMIIYH
jgi:hypothetical protein